MLQKDIVIIGAGLTGLTCAHYLNQKNTDFLVLEQNPEAGGVIHTHQKNGYLYESGPNSGVISHPEVADLFEDLNGKLKVCMANESSNKRYVLKNGKWEALPSGLLGGIKTPLFSWKDKFGILAEPFRKPGTDPNETLANLVRRRMGESFLDYAIDPFILGIYAGDPNKLVPKYALPKLYNLEHNYGSFIGGAIKKKKEDKGNPELKKATKKIFSCENGLQQLTKALLDSAGKEHFIFNAMDTIISPSGKEFIIRFQNKNNETTELIAKKVIFTGGAYSLPKLLPFIEFKKLDAIRNLEYTKVIEVTLGFDKWKGMDLDGFGGLIPFKEKRDILGVLFMSTLFNNRAPKGGALLTLFMGGVRRQDLINLSEDEIRSIVEREMKSLMGIKEFNPDLIEIIRHQYAIPQYYADSADRFKAIEDIQSQFPGLILGGNSRDGIGMADRIKQGKTMAEEA
ncbi:MAG: protoporphyrinogen oxidase [Bacteroidales bacterium]|nr:protoporphyrinogen oxidase [Bacteroidales bacterium]